MLFKGCFSGTCDDLYLPLEGVLGAEETRFEDEVQVVESTHITGEAGQRWGREGVDGQVYREGETMQGTEPKEAL
jgi:hypothetical protein